MSHHGLKRIAVLGEIGSGNLGDDFGYVLLSRELRAAFDEMDILVDIRPLTPNIHGLLAGYQWDAVVTGVGTLLDQANGTHVRALREAAGKCPIAILGSGMSDTRHAPPTTDGKLAFLELVEKTARHVWLRSPVEGFDPGMAAPDPVWLYGWHGNSEARYLVGLNLGYAGFSTLKLDPEYVNRVKAVRSMLGTSYLYAAWPDDGAWMTKLRIAEKEHIHLVTGTEESMQSLNACSTVLCSRIHLGVLAACRGALPVLPDYAQKVSQVFHGTTVPHRIFATDSTADQIADLLKLPAPDTRAACENAQALCKARVREAAMALAKAW